MKIIEAQGNAQALRLKAQAEAEAYKMQAEAEATEMKMKGVFLSTRNSTTSWNRGYEKWSYWRNTEFGNFCVR